MLNFFSLPFAPFFLHLFLFSTSSLLHLSLIAVLIHLNQQPHSPDQTVALTHRVPNRKEEIGRFLCCFVASVHVEADCHLLSNYLENDSTAKLIIKR